MLSRMVLRCMQKAQYATGCEGHFGLALGHYCHFTSPIRRYPDLLVHRSLKYWLRGEMNEKTIDRLSAALPEAALRSSAMEQRAAEAERETVKLKKAQFMEGKIGEIRSGVISGVTSWGIYVELPDTVEGMIRISDLTDDFYYYDDKQLKLVGEYTGKTYTLGQKMDIMVTAADRARRTVDFMPVRSQADRQEKGGAGQKKKKPAMDRTGRVLTGKAGKLKGKVRGRIRKGKR